MSNLFLIGLYFVIHFCPTTYALHLEMNDLSAAPSSDIERLPEDIKQLFLNLLDTPTLDIVNTVSRSFNEIVPSRAVDLAQLSKEAGKPPFLALSSEVNAYHHPKKKHQKKFKEQLEQRIRREAEKICEEFGYQASGIEIEKAGATKIFLTTSESGMIEGEFPLFRPYFYTRIFPRIYNEMSSPELFAHALRLTVFPLFIVAEMVVIVIPGLYHVAKGPYPFGARMKGSMLRGKSVELIEKKTAEPVPNIAFSKLLCRHRSAMDEEQKNITRDKIRAIQKQFN